MNGTTMDASKAGPTYNADADARTTSEATDGNPVSRQGPSESQLSRPKSPYHTIIALSLGRQSLGPAEPRLVEAWMRLNYSTLDHLDRTAFDREVALAVAAINVAPHRDSEELARSYGL